MKHFIKHLAVLLMALAVSTTFASCGDDDEPDGGSNVWDPYYYSRDLDGVWTGYLTFTLWEDVNDDHFGENFNSAFKITIRNNTYSYILKINCPYIASKYRIIEGSGKCNVLCRVPLLSRVQQYRL